MKVFDEKVITLNNGIKDVDVLVYPKEVNVKSNHTKIKAFCKMKGDA